MTLKESGLGYGIPLFLLTSAMMIGLVPAIFTLVRRGEVGGVLLLGFFAIFDLWFIISSLQDCFHRRVIVVDPENVSIKVQRLGKTIEKKIPLKEYEFVCKLPVYVKGFQYFSLLLPHTDRRFEVPLAGAKKNDGALDSRFEHFSRLLGLPKSDFTVD